MNTDTHISGSKTTIGTLGGPTGTAEWVKNAFPVVGNSEVGMKLSALTQEFATKIAALIPQGVDYEIGFGQLRTAYLYFQSSLVGVSQKSNA